MKQTHHNEPIEHTAINVIHEAIATRAYELWIRDGKPENQSNTIWLAAERELYSGPGKSEAKSNGAPGSP